MTPDGTLRLRAIRDGRRISGLRVEKPLPQAAQRLVGCSVDEAIGLVPTLFGVCSRAQGIAAKAACVAAGAPNLARAEAWAEERILATEIAQEHLSRLMLDWPKLFGHPPRSDRFVELQRRLGLSGRRRRRSLRPGGRPARPRRRRASHRLLPCRARTQRPCANSSNARGAAARSARRSRT